MSKSVANKKSFSFVGGLNTEGGPLAFPPNTWQNGDNVVPDIDGSLSKRYAINFESGYALSSGSNTPTDEQNGAHLSDEWNSVGGSGTRNFVVVQRGATVHFYDNTGTTISATEKSFTINLASFKAAGNPNVPGVAPIACTSANGKLLITSADTNPILVTYDSDSDTITATAVAVQIRDLYGVTDGLAVDEKPLTLSDTHHYNLLNQGWLEAHITTYFTAKAVYPSNAQSWTAGKDTSDNFDSTLLDKQDFGTSPAPKGRFVLSLFNRDRSTASAVPNLSVETELYRPTTCAFYAGRAWYAGTRSDGINSWVVFSQVADTDDKYGKCYQDADPTSEVVSDLVDTDGGVIPIQDAGTLVRLLPTQNSLLVFAENGIWQILGGGVAGFSASSYEVRKLASVGCVAARSVVEAEQAIYFWSADGVWVVAPTEIGGFTVQNITNTTIQTYYVGEVPITGRTYASGRYHLETKTVYWAFNSSTAQDSIVRRFKKDRLLCLDLRLKAFYTYAFSSLAAHSPYFTDVLITKSKTVLSTTYTVVTSTEDTVISAASDDVTATLSPAVLRNSELRFLTQAPQSSSTSFKTTFARFEDGLTAASKFKDWYAADTAGGPYDAFITTGYDLGNDQGGDKSVQALYCMVFMRRTETGVDANGDPINPSSCTLQARWDWTDASVANKWSAEQEVYRHRRVFLPSVPSATFNDGYPVVVTKNKIRGRGKALHLKFTAHATKDMQLHGWAVTFIGNTNV